MTERIKIRRDTAREGDISFKVRSAIGLINGSIKTELEKIGSQLSPDTLADFFGNAGSIAKDYQDRMQKDLSMISLPSIRSMLETNAKEAWITFNNKRISLIDQIGAQTRSYITVEDGWAVFSDETKRRLAEECDVYLQNKEEIELYRQHVAACEALNAMFKGYRRSAWQELFEFEDGKFCPSEIHYDILLKNIKQNGNIK